MSSRPVWGAWIEIVIDSKTKADQRSRAPYGARGLKSFEEMVYGKVLRSRPVWGAWIEILLSSAAAKPTGTSRPVWGAWIEIPLIYL